MNGFEVDSFKQIINYFNHYISREKVTPEILKLYRKSLKIMLYLLNFI